MQQLALAPIRLAGSVLNRTTTPAPTIASITQLLLLQYLYQLTNDQNKEVYWFAFFTIHLAQYNYRLLKLLESC